MTQLCGNPKCGHEEKDHRSLGSEWVEQCYVFDCPCLKFEPQTIQGCGKSFEEEMVLENTCDKFTLCPKCTPQTPQTKPLNNGVKKTLSSPTSSNEDKPAETSDSDYFASKETHEALVKDTQNRIKQAKDFNLSEKIKNDLKILSIRIYRIERQLGLSDISPKLIKELAEEESK